MKSDGTNCAVCRLASVLFGKVLQLQLTSGGMKKMHRFHQETFVLRNTRFQQLVLPELVGDGSAGN